MLAACQPLRACVSRAHIPTVSILTYLQDTCLVQSAARYQTRTTQPCVTVASHYNTHTKCSVICVLNHSILQAKPFSTGGHVLQQKLQPKESKEIMEPTEKPFGELSTAQKVKRVGKDATYTGVILLGLGVTGLMVYAIGRELLSGQSPSGIYGRALKMCRRHEELTCAIGTPLKGYGELTRRGRRRHVSHSEYERDGRKYMRMKFYVEGPDGKGTAHLEVMQNDSGKYDFRYLFVELDNLERRTFIIEDNR